MRSMVEGARTIFLNYRHRRPMTPTAAWSTAANTSDAAIRTTLTPELRAKRRVAGRVGAWLPTCY